MTGRAAAAVLVFFGAAGGEAIAQTADASALSVEEFVALRPDRDLLVSRARQLTVEGRVESVGLTLLKLSRCDVPFRSAEGEFPNEVRRGGRVEVTGRLARDGDGYEFRVASVRVLGSDLAEYRRERARVERGDAAALRAVGERARARAAYYDDAELEAYGKGLIVQSLELEAAGLGPGDGVEKLRLADALVAVEGPPDVTARLRYEGLRAVWDGVKSDEAAAAAAFADFRGRVADLLPGATTPGPELPAADDLTSTLSGRRGRELAGDRELRQRAGRGAYDVIYRRADAATRSRLERLFYEQIVLTAFGLRDVDDAAVASGRWRPPANSAGAAAIAERLTRLLPERADLIAALRGRALEERLGSVETATRDELVALTDRLRAEGRAGDAERAARRWLAGRVKQLRFDGVDGLLRAAAETLEFGGDPAAAAALAIEAAELDPDSAAVAALLDRLGYVRGEDGTWAVAGTTTVSRIDAAVREGRVVEGMTADQVRRTLGPPETVSRSIGISEVDEVWVYGRGPSRLLIQLRRYGSQPPESAKVVGQGRGRR